MTEVRLDARLPSAGGQQMSLADIRDGQAATVEDEEMAVRRRFVGSPSFRVDDTELIPVDASDKYGLTCRVYQLADGRFSPTPDPGHLRQAVAAHFRQLMR
jgi:hypothetical protein